MRSASTSAKECKTHDSENYNRSQLHRLVIHDIPQPFRELAFTFVQGRWRVNSLGIYCVSSACLPLNILLSVDWAASDHHYDPSGVWSLCAEGKGIYQGRPGILAKGMREMREGIFTAKRRSASVNDAGEGQRHGDIDPARAYVSQSRCDNSC